MVFLEYRKADGVVVQIHNEKSLNIVSENCLAKSDIYNIGDEFTYYIVVNKVEKEESGNDFVVISSSAIRQSPPAKDILERMSSSKKEIADLKQSIAELTIILGGEV